MYESPKPNTASTRALALQVGSRLPPPAKLPAVFLNRLLDSLLPAVAPDRMSSADPVYNDCGSALSPVADRSRCRTTSGRHCGHREGGFTMCCLSIASVPSLRMIDASAEAIPPVLRMFGRNNTDDINGVSTVVRSCSGPKNGIRERNRKILATTACRTDEDAMDSSSRCAQRRFLAF